MTDKKNTSSGQPDVFPPSISTLEAAKRLGVTVPTIQRWLDQGALRGWKTPGGHRRIALSSVQAYIEKRMDPLADFAREAPDILIIEDDPVYLELLRETLLEMLPQASIRSASDGFEGLAEVATRLPSCVITDLLWRWTSRCGVRRNRACKAIFAFRTTSLNCCRRWAGGPVRAGPRGGPSQHSGRRRGSSGGEG